MFTVIIQMLACASDEMQRSVRRLNQQINDVQHIISSLRRLSEYEEVIHKLKIHKQNMETEKHQLLEMMAALNQIQRTYIRSEHNILEYGEQVRSANYYRAMDVINLRSVQQSISAYHIV